MHDSVSSINRTSGDGPMEWVDARGRRWSVDARSDAVTLDGPERFAIERADYDTDIYISPTGSRSVVRLSGPTEDIGFLLPNKDVQDLIRRMDVQVVTPDQMVEREAKAAKARRPDFPRMHAGTVFAVICAALAFLPFVGVLFGSVAMSLAIVQRRRSPANAANSHIRKACTIAMVWTCWGLMVCVLSSWSLLNPITNVDALSSMSPSAASMWFKLVLGFIVVIASLSIHEAAHAITAWWCGDDFARSLGRVTLNPIAHIDPFGTIILPLMLGLTGAPVFGYAKPVPVRLEGIRRWRRAHILVSIAGPGSNLLLAALSLSVLLAIGCVLRGTIPPIALIQPGMQLTGFVGASVLSLILSILTLSVIINVLLAMFNMLPIPPLDGSWVLEHMFPNSLGPFYARIRPLGFIIFLMLFMTGVIERLLVPFEYVMAYVNTLIWSCSLGVWLGA